jgi:hypothetical protein
VIEHDALHSCLHGPVCTEWEIWCEAPKRFAPLWGQLGWLQSPNFPQPLPKSTRPAFHEFVSAGYPTTSLERSLQRVSRQSRLPQSFVDLTINRNNVCEASGRSAHNWAALSLVSAT